LKKKIVILCPYPHNGAPSQRFRFEQQLPYLKEHFEIEQFSFWSERSNTILYSQGNIILKAFGLLIGLLRRCIHTFRCINSDIVFIHREVIPLGSHCFEWIIAKILKKKIIFDFDDAIWNLDSSNGNKSFEWLKKPKKTENIITLSMAVFAGNNYLGNYARQFNNNVSIIPTTIDTGYHIPKHTNSSKKICIGWTGSNTTIKHFESIIPVLIKIKEKYSNVYFKLIGDESFYSKELDLTGTKWVYESEIEDLQELDIGLMPLPQDEWSKGKCGFKGLQYMAIGVPAIMAPVGVNTEIIEDGINGYVASADSEWIDRLSILIESKELREKIGSEGRETIVKKYSVKSQQNLYLSKLTSLTMI
jgi:glycosyltransferase involved in cell wall biosynthesis